MSQKGFSGATFIFCLMLPILTLLIIGCSVNSDEDESQPNTGIIGSTYTNREYGFQISLPTELIGWSITNPTEGALVTMKGPSEPPPQPIASLGAELKNVSLTSKEYLEANVVALSESERKDWKEESRRAIKISGEDGYEIIYTYKTANDVALKMIMQLVIKGKYGYFFIGGDIAEKFVEDPFLKIMETFRFLP